MSLTTALARVGVAVKGLAAMVFQARMPWTWSGWRHGQSFDYARAVGTGSGSSIVQAVVLWLCRTFPEAPLRLRAAKADGTLDPLPAHPLLKLIARPNPHYSGVLLWWGTLADWCLGNAYWLKIRSRAGAVVQLWWIPSTLIEPRWPEDGSAFLSHYDYRPDLSKPPIRLDEADVVHFRYGLDPLNPRKGLSPLGSLLREVFTDDEAANFSASLLRNLGVPGLVIAPGEDFQISQEDADHIKAETKQKFGGDNRGEPLVLSAKMTATVLAFSPQQMNLKDLRRLPEERVTAIYGVAAIVVGLGAGLDRSTFANYAEARTASIESNIIPTQRLFSEELATQLLPDFEAKPDSFLLDFDVGQMRALQENQDALHARAREGYKAGLLTRRQSLQMIGEAHTDADEFLLIPISASPMNPATLLDAPPPPPAATAPRGALPAAPKMRALPVGTKAAHRVGPVIERLRTRLQQPTERAVARLLHRQRDAILGRLEGRKARKDAALTADDLFNEEDEAAALSAALDPQYRALLAAVLTLVQEALSSEFTLDDPTTRAYLADAGANIRGITTTTLDAIRDALQEGQAAGEGVGELAARIRDLPAFDQARATTVARTELAQASQQAALATYRASGVVTGCLVLDGDSDPACADANGQVWTFEEAAANPLEHPNCVRVFTPWTDALPDQEEAA